MIVVTHSAFLLAVIRKGIALRGAVLLPLVETVANVFPACTLLVRAMSFASMPTKRILIVASHKSVHLMKIALLPTPVNPMVLNTRLVVNIFAPGFPS